MTTLDDKVPFGRTGLRVSRLGLGSSFGVGGDDLAHALDRGVNYFYWGTYRAPHFAAGLRPLLRARRDDVVLVVQTYTRAAWMLRPSLELALRRLRTTHADVLLLGWWNVEVAPRIVEAALKARDAGLARHLMVSCHHRPRFAGFIADPAWGAIMTRYNAAHPGAEQDVFPHLARSTPRPGVVAYTATSWGQLIDPAWTPPGERTPRATDCYRFALGNPNVDVTIAGPANGEQLDQAMAALDEGPLTADEDAWMRRVGVAVRERARARGKSAIDRADKLVDWLSRARMPGESRR